MVSTPGVYSKLVSTPKSMCYRDRDNVERERERERGREEESVRVSAIKRK